jgi:hypothetical protein
MAYTHPSGTRPCLRSGCVSRGPGDDHRPTPLAMAARRGCAPAAAARPASYPGPRAYSRGQVTAAAGSSPLAELETCA